MSFEAKDCNTSGALVLVESKRIEGAIESEISDIEGCAAPPASIAPAPIEKKMPAR